MLFGYKRSIYHCVSNLILAPLMARVFIMRLCDVMSLGKMHLGDKFYASRMAEHGEVGGFWAQGEKYILTDVADCIKALVGFWWVLFSFSIGKNKLKNCFSHLVEAPLVVYVCNFQSWRMLAGWSLNY